METNETARANTAEVNKLVNQARNLLQGRGAVVDGAGIMIDPEARLTDLQTAGGLISRAIILLATTDWSRNS